MPEIILISLTALVIIALVIAVVLLATKNKEKKVDKSENVNLNDFSST